MQHLRVADYIVSDKEICHGKPCFKGTRVMVASALELLEAGQTIPDILKAYPSLTPQHIQAALHFAALAVDDAKLIQS